MESIIQFVTYSTGSSNSSYTCEEKTVVAHDPHVIVFSALGIISSIATYFFMAALFKKFAFKLQWHINAKVLFYTSMLNSLAMALMVGSVFGFYIVRLIKSKGKEACDTVVLIQDCLQVRFAFLALFYQITLIHIAMTVERAYAIHNHKLEIKSNGVVGLFLAVLATVAACGVTYYVTLTENPSQYAVSCISFIASNIAEKIFFMLYIQLIVELVVLFYQKYLSAKNYTVVWTTLDSNGNARKKCLRNESIAILKIMTPMVITTACVVGIYIVVMLVIKNLPIYLTSNISTYTYIVPHIPLIHTVVTYFAFVKGEKEKIEFLRKTAENQEVRTTHESLEQIEMKTIAPPADVEAPTNNVPNV